MPPQNSNGWSEWSRHVLAELERLDDNIKELTVAVNSLVTEVAMLKVKAGIWGAIGGAIPVAVGLLVYYLRTKP